MCDVSIYTYVWSHGARVTRTMASHICTLSFDQLWQTGPILSILEMAPAFITAVVPPTMRRRKCQAETTHATEREHNEKPIDSNTVESNR